MWDNLSRDYFINALRDPELQRQVKLSHPKILQDALEAAQEIEAISVSLEPTPSHRRANIRQVRARHNSESNQSRHNNENLNVQSDINELKSMMRQFLQSNNTRPNNFDRSRPRPRSSDRSRSTRGISRPRRCYNCHDTGHLRNACPLLRESRATETRHTDSEN